MAYIETPLKTIIEGGDGLESPECGDLVEVNCTGLLLDGTPVWSSRKPLKFTLSKGPPLVKKWHAGLKTMKKGEKARFTIPFVLSDLSEEETPVQVDVKMLSWEKVQGKKKIPIAKKNKRNANAAPWYGKRVQAEGLPPGWLMGRKKGTQGNGYNKYYIQPGTGKVFKTKKVVESFLEQDLGGASNESEEDAELDASEDLAGASNERDEDTPRRELDASEDGQIDPYEEIENLQRQLHNGKRSCLSSSYEMTSC